MTLFLPAATRTDGPYLADSVENVRFSVRLNSRTITTGEHTHHIEWFLGSSLTIAAQLVG
jgi:hypothetical protein